MCSKAEHVFSYLIGCLAEARPGIHTFHTFLASGVSDTSPCREHLFACAIIPGGYVLLYLLTGGKGTHQMGGRGGVGGWGEKGEAKVRGEMS